MDYPQDIIDAAKDALAPIASPDLASDYEVRLIAQAIMAERKRCLNVIAAENEWGGADMTDVATKIRDGSKPRHIPGWSE